jgi:hypothetical protein
MTAFQLEQQHLSPITGKVTWFRLANREYTSEIFADRMIADAAKRGQIWRRVPA